MTGQCGTLSGLPELKLNGELLLHYTHILTCRHRVPVPLCKPVLYKQSTSTSTTTVMAYYWLCILVVCTCKRYSKKLNQKSRDRSVHDNLVILYRELHVGSLKTVLPELGKRGWNMKSTSEL